MKFVSLVAVVCFFCLDNLQARPSVLDFAVRQAANTTTSHKEHRCSVARDIRTECGHAGIDKAHCLTHGCCWDDTIELPAGVPHCFDQGIATSTWKKAVYISEGTFCDTANQYLVADANGDGYSDTFCYDAGTGNLTYALGGLTDPYTTGATVTLGGCTGTGDVFKLGDVTGDGKADAVCVAADGGVTVWPADDTQDPIYDANRSWADANFGLCANVASGTIFLDDFTGDGNADLLCVDGGNRYLAGGDAAGTFLIPTKDPNYDTFCTGTGDVLYVRDFDADGRFDLLCRVNGGAGGYLIALSDGDGFVLNEDFSMTDAWCSGTDDRLVIGDPNGDHHDDLICIGGNGAFCTKYASHIFKDGRMFTKEVCDNMGTWCANPTPVIGDHNFDGMDDLYCRGAVDGKSHVTIATVRPPLTDFVQIDWTSGADTFCANKELYSVDAFGNNKGDVLCHDVKAGGMERVAGDDYGQLVLTNQWTSPDGLRFCHKHHRHDAYPALFTGDNDNDGDTDLFCAYHLSGDIELSVNDETTGQYGGGAVIVQGFCQGQDSRVNAADLDNDGKADFLCRTNTGFKIHLQDGANTEIDGATTSNPNWCLGVYDEVIAGRFANGHTDDLLCHNQDTGVKSLLSLNGGTVEIDESMGLWNGPADDWCLSKNNKALKAGDFNGDLYTDLLCHNADGTMSVFENQGENQDKYGVFNREYSTNISFCSEIGSDLQVSDVNGDGLDDMTCHTSDGRIDVTESHIVVSRNELTPVNLTTA